MYASKKKIERGTYYNIFSSQSQLLSRLLSDDLIAWTKRELGEGGTTSTINFPEKRKENKDLIVVLGSERKILQKNNTSFKNASVASIINLLS